MNQFDISGNDDLRFDRLVDGELSDSERRELLALLDDEPGEYFIALPGRIKHLRLALVEGPECRAHAEEDD